MLKALLLFRGATAIATQPLAIDCANPSRRLPMRRVGCSKEGNSEPTVIRKSFAVTAQEFLLCNSSQLPTLISWIFMHNSMVKLDKRRSAACRVELLALCLMPRLFLPYFKLNIWNIQFLPFELTYIQYPPPLSLSFSFSTETIIAGSIFANKAN